MTDRRRWLLVSGALVLALLGVAFLTWSISQHHEARDDLTEVRAQLAANQATVSQETESLRHAHQSVASVRAHLTALEQGVTGLGDLDQRDLETVRAAVQAGVAGTLADYNAAVDRRIALDPEHDATLEQLRQQANAVITALDTLR